MAIDPDELGPDPYSQALIRLVPTVGPVVASWRQETFDRKKRRAEKLAAATAEDLDLKVITERIMASERLTDMFEQALDAAMSTSSDAKIRLLGRALAHGATDDEAKVDEAEQLLRLAFQLDPVDLRALRALERWTTKAPIDEVAFALQLDPGVAGAIVKRLEGLHLIGVEREARICDVSDKDDDEVQIEELWEVTPATASLLKLLASRDPAEVQRPGAAWPGLTDVQVERLEHLIQLVRLNPWRPREAEAVRRTLCGLLNTGMTYPQVRTALRSIGLGKRYLETLDNWAEAPE